MSTTSESHLRSSRVGIVGATGLVGELMRSVLAERAFPVESMRLFASARSAGKQLDWKGTKVAVEDAATADYSGLDVVFFSAGASTSRQLTLLTGAGDPLGGSALEGAKETPPSRPARRVRN